MHTSTLDFADTTVIGARYLPGFQTDLTSWTLSIDDTGRLVQTLDTFAPVPKKARRAVIQIDQTLVLEWLARADALDFTALQTMEFDVDGARPEGRDQQRYLGTAARNDRRSDHRANVPQGCKVVLSGGPVQVGQ